MNGLRAVIINKLNNNEGVGLMTKNMPFSVTLHPGSYYWCSCGKSIKEPFCDGSHEGTGKKPVEFVIKKTEQVALCACQRTKNPPLCDGTHAR